jgi:hypothetical protein
LTIRARASGSSISGAVGSVLAGSSASLIDQVTGSSNAGWTFSSGTSSRFATAFRKRCASSTSSWLTSCPSSTAIRLVSRHTGTPSKRQ